GGGGGAVTVHCPAGAWVTRMDSWFDDPDRHASGVSIFCANATLVRGAATYSITLQPVAQAPWATATGGNRPTHERQAACWLVSAKAVCFNTGLSDNFVEGLGAHCGTSAVTLAADNTITLNFVQDADRSYNTWAGQPGSFFVEACASNEVIVGYTLHTGSW